MKSVFGILVVLLVTAIAEADSWGPPSPQGFSSPDGNYVLRIVPRDDPEAKGKAKAEIFKLSRDGKSYQRTRTITLLNDISPVSGCISNEGDFYTFDDWYHKGRGHVAVWYSRNGKVKADFTLQQLFPEDALKEIMENHRSVSSIHWRRGLARFNHEHLIIYDALGGYIAITDGKVEYRSKDHILNRR